MAKILLFYSEPLATFHNGSVSSTVIPLIQTILDLEDNENSPFLFRVRPDAIRQII